MKLHRLKFSDSHRILKGLEIDFRKSDGSPYDTIILAGENGIGKTTILNALYNFFKGIECVFEELEYSENGILYIAKSKDKEVFAVSANGGTYHDVHLNNLNNDRMSGIIWKNAEEPKITPQNRMACMSEAASNFASVTDSRGEVNPDKDVYSNVQNHLIILERQDNELYKKLNLQREANNQAVLRISEFDAAYSKIHRFKKAFNMMFENLKFDGIKSDTNRTDVYFTKNNDSVEIDDLSTGEKQIVFRGSQLLLSGSDTVAAFIDEPEISMHPRWQQKILNFYKHLFIDDCGKQSAQLFVATHSDRVIASAFDDEDTKIICLTQEDGHVVCNNPSVKVLSTITLAETNYAVYGIYSTDYHIELFSQLQHAISIANPSMKVSIKKVDNSIKRQAQYDLLQHKKQYQHVDENGHLQTTYETLPCYVRNCIDHPNSPDDNGHNQFYRETDLIKSTELLRELLKAVIDRNYDYSGL